MPYYEHAIELQPEYAQAHFNLGMTLLQLGDYTRGFAEYEWRWQTGQFTPFQCPHPQWDGTPIPDKTLLIHTEQGAGDAIQFARYLPLGGAALRQADSRVPGRLDAAVCHACQALRRFGSAGQISVAEFDTYLPLLSLPRVLWHDARDHSRRVPYIDVAGDPSAKAARHGRVPVPTPVGSAQGGAGVGGQPDASPRSTALVSVADVAAGAADAGGRSSTVCRKGSGVRSWRSCRRTSRCRIWTLSARLRRTSPSCSTSSIWSSRSIPQWRMWRGRWASRCGRC